MTDEAFELAARCGMTLAYRAERQPDDDAIVCEHGDRTYGELNANANRLSRALRDRDIAKGDAVALMVANRPEFAEVVAASQRTGLRMTPINWHLTADEAGVHHRRLRSTACSWPTPVSAASPARSRTAPRGSRCSSRWAATSTASTATRMRSPSEDGADITDPVLGRAMLYTSGTTGRPKGVDRAQAAPVAVSPFGYVAGESRHLCTGPLYHAAPLGFSLAGPLNAGAAVVLMDGWTAADTLRLIESHHVTHSHMVPTMFHRLLSLPEDVRARADVSSLRLVLHGAAPCPAWVKQAMIEWWGPVFTEYYAATEGLGTWVKSDEWLRKPGTVGKPDPPDTIRVLDERRARLRAERGRRGLPEGARRDPLRLLQGSRQDGRELSAATTTRSATSVTSTPTATCS